MRFVLEQQMAENISKHNKDFLLPHKYSVGQFVLLKKIQIQGPHHGIKLKRIYHAEPFRIVRRYKTNVLLVHYNIKYIKNRLKHEGKVTKNMGVLARLSRLKPIPNPLRFLNLQISTQSRENHRAG